ncbi:MAG: DUF721 domain-containing protein [Spirochaetales bacterium]|nr:DUF721 domain-containing protein [Spirochaetales bacterium]
MNSIKKASDLVKTLFDGISIDHKEDYYSLFSGWERAAGLDIASHSKIRELTKGILIVAVDHPGWGQMIHLKKSSLLAVLKKQYPALNIRDLRIVPEKEGERRPSGPVKPSGEALVRKSRPRQEEATGAEVPQNFENLLQRLEKAVKEKNKPER